ncbi:MAG TPA: dockerin type I domain-containing protein, partial [Candidatus Anammoximicrobium sp.]|nr:dockerin type I domain-containing protein [Candidatus Anammoximicrobium sp.]
THEVQVSNAPPVVSITGPATGIRGESLAYESQIQDPGAADTHALQWTATAASGAMVATGTEASFSFTPWQIGVYTVALTVTDEDGAADTDVQTVTVAWWALSPSATDPSQSVLTIVGSDGPDRINVTGKRGRYTVSILEYNTDLHERHDIAAALSKIVVFGSAGNDAIDVDADVSAELYGDGGDDRLYGGRGDDLLVGGVGNDWLWGRDGNDCLDGGSGNDWLFGGRGDDTLVGGSGRNHLFGGPGHDVLNPNDGTPAGEDPPNPLADGENEYDVNLDGRVTAADALAIVNRLNEHGSGPVSDGAEWPGASVLLLDVDGSQTIEPADALQVVNYLNSPAASAGEGEADGEMVQTVPPTVGDQAAARLAIAGVPLAEFSVRQGAADDGQWTGLVEVRSGWGGQRRIAAGEAWFAADRVLAFQLEWPHERKPLSIKGFKAATDAGIWDSALDAMAADVDRVWNPRSERLSGPVGIE